MEAIPTLESFFDYYSSPFFHSSLLLYSTTLLFDHHLPILPLPSYQMDQLIAPVTPANPAAIHNAVSTHLRPHYGGRVIPLLLTPIPSTLPLPTTPKSTTILERRLVRKALLNA
jgi:hypothetical protein